MAAPQEKTGARLSLFDRLIDDQPDVKAEAPASAWEEARRIKESLRRDLSALLNTRRGEPEFDAEFVESRNSILTFGVSDFTARNLTSRPDQEGLRLSIERAIREFEPRLARVSVAVRNSDSAMPVLGFEISAVLRLDSGPEDVYFNAGLHRDTRRMNVQVGE
ncbi:MAG TPA: type VI secretion system baseplate subunit TssE [Bryobacteraceae bacterium]|nr:type VI secretion system baseplate subunit TssE [Bryobacteraceae bacterium]